MPLEHKGYSVHVCCDGKELAAFGALEAGKEMSCWIASKEAKEFSLHWKDKSSGSPTLVRIYVDGRLVRQCAQEPDIPAGSCRGVRLAPGKERPFVFSALVLTDDDSVAASGVSEALGTIQLTVTRIEGWMMSGKLLGGVNFSDTGPVHERTKKAGVHAVSLGDVKKIEAGNACRPYGMEKTPFVTFTFRYRPIELLRANGVAPPPQRTTKPPNGKKRALDALEDPHDAGPSNPKRCRREDPPVKMESIKEEGGGVNVAHDITFLREQLTIIQRRLEEAEAAQRTQPVFRRGVSPIRVPTSSNHEVIDLT